MNNKFDELTKNMARSVTRRAALKNFGVGVASQALAGLLSLSCAAANPNIQTRTVFDPAGDAVFPYDLYGAPAPPYLDVLRASVSYSRGVFHFEIQMSSQIPADPSPGFDPAVNHLGSTFGILTDPKTAGPAFHF